MENSSARSPPWGPDLQQTADVQACGCLRSSPVASKEMFWLNFQGKLWAGKWCPRQMKNIGFEFCLSQIFIVLAVETRSSQKSAYLSQLPKMGIVPSYLQAHTQEICDIKDYFGEQEYKQITLFWVSQQQDGDSGSTVLLRGSKALSHYV